MSCSVGVTRFFELVVYSINHKMKAHVPAYIPPKIGTGVERDNLGYGTMDEARCVEWGDSEQTHE